jgi:integrase
MGTPVKVEAPAAAKLRLRPKANGAFDLLPHRRSGRAHRGHTWARAHVGPAGGEGAASRKGTTVDNVRQLPSGRYQVRVMAPDGRRVAKTFRTKAEAVRFSHQSAIALSEGRFISPSSSAMTLAQWEPLWWKARLVAPSTLRNDRYRLDTHVLPRFGSTPLFRITYLEVQTWLRELSDSGMAGGSVRKCRNTLSGMLKVAILDNRMPGPNPAHGGPLPPEALPSDVYLTREELAAILAELRAERPGGKHSPRMAASIALRETYAVIIELMAYTGLRWGEASGLHRRRLNLNSRRLQVVDINDVGTIRDRPKNRPSARTVPVVPSLVVTLERYLRQNPTGPNDLVFRKPCGTPLDNHALNPVWHAARQRAGVQYARLHDLRHTYASWLVQAAVPLVDIGRVMGHKSPVTTHRYAHLQKDRYDNIEAALDFRAADIEAALAAAPG